MFIIVALHWHYIEMPNTTSNLNTMHKTLYKVAEKTETPLEYIPVSCSALFFVQKWLPL